MVVDNYKHNHLTLWVHIDHHFYIQNLNPNNSMLFVILYIIKINIIIRDYLKNKPLSHLAPVYPTGQKHLNPSKLFGSLVHVPQIQGFLTLQTSTCSQLRPE